MKNLKFFGIVMMLVMGMSFASCSSDDDGPGSGSIKENLEGEWFLVSVKEVCSDDGTTYITWDYDDQTAYGVCSDRCNDHEPEKLYIECVGKNTYEVTWSYYYGRWNLDESEIFEIEGNIISEYTEEYAGNVFYEKVYIKSISANELVIVEEDKEVYEDGIIHNDVETYTYRRNN